MHKVYNNPDEVFNEILKINDNSFCFECSFALTNISFLKK